MSTFQFTMVGASFRPAAAKDIIRSLTIGDTVQLRADPHNEYDSTAVAVDKDGTHIGFVPAAENGALFTALQDGAEFEGTIIAFESTLKPVIEVEMDSDEGHAQDEDGW